MFDNAIRLPELRDKAFGSGFTMGSFGWELLMLGVGLPLHQLERNKLASSVEGTQQGFLGSGEPVGSSMES